MYECLGLLSNENENGVGNHSVASCTVSRQRTMEAQGPIIGDRMLCHHLGLTNLKEGKERLIVSDNLNRR